MRVFKRLLILIAELVFRALTVMLVWNWVVVGMVKGIPELTFLKAYGLIVLSNALFSFRRAQAYTG